MEYQLDDGSKVSGTPEEVLALIRGLAPPVVLPVQDDVVGSAPAGRLHAVPGIGPVIGATAAEEDWPDPDLDPEPQQLFGAEEEALDKIKAMIGVIGRRRLSTEERAAILFEVRRVDMSLEQLGREVGISHSTLRRWGLDEEVGEALSLMEARAGGSGLPTEEPSPQRVFFYNKDNNEKNVVEFLLGEDEGFEFTTNDLAPLYEGPRSDAGQAISQVVTEMHRTRRGIRKINGHNRYRLSKDAVGAEWRGVSAPAAAQIKWDEENGYYPE